MSKNENYIPSMWMVKKTNRQEIKKLWGFVSDYYVSINLSDLESLSFSNTDVLLDTENNSLKLRFKTLEKDLKTPRKYSILNKETKELTEHDYSYVINRFLELGFIEASFDFEEKVKMWEENKRKQYNS